MLVVLAISVFFDFRLVRETIDDAYDHSLADAAEDIAAHIKVSGAELGISLSADAANVLGQPVRVFTNDVDGALAVGLEDAHGTGSRDPMRVQEDHDAADDLLICPAGRNLSGADFPDAGNFTKTFG